MLKGYISLVGLSVTITLLITKPPIGIAFLIFWVLVNAIDVAKKSEQKRK